jgi:hypothetical protein
MGGRESERDNTAYDEWDRPGLVVDEFVPPDVAGETVGILTPWPAPKYHDTPSRPVMQIGPLCTVQVCQPTVSLWPSQRPASLRYHSTGLCVACHARNVAEWKRPERKGKKEATHA